MVTLMKDFSADSCPLSLLQSNHFEDKGRVWRLGCFPFLISKINHFQNFFQICHFGIQTEFLKSVFVLGEQIYEIVYHSMNIIELVKNCYDKWGTNRFCLFYLRLLLHVVQILSLWKYINSLVLCLANRVPVSDVCKVSLFNLGKRD